MALTEIQQAQRLITRATKIVVFVPSKATPDNIATSLALYLAIQQLKEEGVEVVSPSHIAPTLQFLPGSSQVKMQPHLQTDVVVDIAGPTNAIGVRQEPLTGGVRIHITFPENTALTKDDIESIVRRLPYDVVITVGLPDLEALGQIFTDHTDFFYNTPIINIDHHAANEHFGTVNLVDITAGSNAEAAFDLITLLTEDGGLDHHIATNLYAGIIAGTESFQRPSTTPRSFQIAARLMELEADRESVIQQLVKTKPLQLLKLAGRMYARLRYDKYMQVFWSILRPLDFRESGATNEDIPAALRELTNNIADFNAAFLLHEHNQQFVAHIVIGRGLRQRQAEIQAQLGAHKENGTLQVTLHTTDLDEAEAEALEKIRQVVP